MDRDPRRPTEPRNPADDWGPTAWEDAGSGDPTRVVDVPALRDDGGERDRHEERTAVSRRVPLEGGSGAGRASDRHGDPTSSSRRPPREHEATRLGAPGPRRPTPPGGAPRRPAAGPTAAPAPRARRGGVPVLLVLILAAIGAGLLGWMGQTATTGTVRGSWEFSRLGGPWLVAGFVGGAIGGWRRGIGGLVLGIVAGAVIVGAGSVAYYGLSYWDGGNDARRAAKLGIGWGAAGAGVGGALGLVGAAYATALGRRPSRDGGRVVGSWVHGAALGTLGGLLMGESIALLWVWDGGGLRAVATLEGLGGVAIVAVGAAARSWRFIVGAVLACAAAATVAPIATTALRETLRTIGWAGA